MELEILENTTNSLLGRQQIHFAISHDGAKSPERKEVRELLSKVLKASKEGLVLDHMRSEFGMGRTVGYAKVYPTKAAAQQNEPYYRLKRNGLEPPRVEKAAAEGAAAAPAKKRKGA